jgi:hypothetical protein
MIALLVATVLRFTTPAFDAVGPGSCDAGPAPCHDLALVRLYGQPQWGGDTLLAEHGTAWPGAPDSFEVALDASPWCLWAVAVDSAGNESCRGTPLQVNGALAVAPPPAGLWLGPPRPNPAGDLVAVPFCLPEAGAASLEVFDLQGRRVATLADGVLSPGVHVRLWGAKGAAAGIYFVRMKVGIWQAVRRFLVLI